MATNIVLLVQIILYCTQEYSRVAYAGHEFRTESSQQGMKTDNAKVRVPFRGPRGGLRLQQFYGQICRIFMHRAWVGGPEICVLDVQWYENRGMSSVSGNPLVRVPDEPSSEFNLTLLSNCYQIPIAVWPHDLLQLQDQEDDAAASSLLEIIDRNQQENAS